jgi:hypothetical protein
MRYSPTSIITPEILTRLGWTYQVRNQLVINYEADYEKRYHGPIIMCCSQPREWPASAP